MLDCSEPQNDKVIDVVAFADFLKSKIKVNGKKGNLGEDVAVLTEGAKVVVTATIAFSKRYLKYLAKKYLKQETLREYLFVHASDKNTYQLKYFNVAQDEEDQ